MKSSHFWWILQLDCCGDGVVCEEGGKSKSRVGRCKMVDRHELSIRVCCDSGCDVKGRWWSGCRRGTIVVPCACGMHRERYVVMLRYGSLPFDVIWWETKGYAMASTWSWVISALMSPHGALLIQHSFVLVQWVFSFAKKSWGGLCCDNNSWFGYWGSAVLLVLARITLVSHSSSETLMKERATPKHDMLFV